MNFSEEYFLEETEKANYFRGFFYRHFLRIPDIFLKALPLTEAAILATIIDEWFYREERKQLYEGYCFYTSKRLSEKIGITEKNIRININKIIKKQLLEAKRNVPDPKNPFLKRNYYRPNLSNIYDFALGRRDLTQKVDTTVKTILNITKHPFSSKEEEKGMSDLKNRSSQFYFFQETKIIDLWNEKASINNSPFKKHRLSKKITKIELKIRYKIRKIIDKGFKHKDIIEAINNWFIFMTNYETVFSKYSAFFKNHKLTFFLEPNSKDINTLKIEFENKAPFYDAVKGLDNLIEKFSKSESYMKCSFPETAKEIRKLWLDNYPNKPKKETHFAVAADKWHLFVSENESSLRFEVPELPHLCLDYLFQALSEINPRNTNLLASNMLYDNLLPNYFREKQFMDEE